MRCKTPVVSDTEAGKKMNFRISFNGYNFVNSKYTFLFYREPIVHFFSPQYGPAGGGFQILVKGKNFVDLSEYPNEFVCVFYNVEDGIKIKSAAKFVNNETISCSSPGIFEAGNKIRVGISNTGGQQTFYSKKNFTFYQIVFGEPLSGPADVFTYVKYRGQGFPNTHKYSCKLGTKIISAKYVDSNLFE